MPTLLSILREQEAIHTKTAYLKLRQWADKHSLTVLSCEAAYDSDRYIYVEEFDGRRYQVALDDNKITHREV